MVNPRDVYASELLKTIDLFLEKIKRKDMTLEDAYLFTLGATRKDVDVCIFKIARALPDALIVRRGLAQEEIQESIIKDFVLFMAQEKISSDDFDDSFANFIYSVISDTSRKYMLVGWVSLLCSQTRIAVTLIAVGLSQAK